ncbi:hypothetical protein [Acerihabitans arboris]|uniref:Uncharacterized protein n=1 Tax=Acerihabitans arboris TaxID=2691583 RepID=A0A845SIM3_9GAMM|nr:hypothetical protein [Acerihabitans arboris]NDL62814.1 hypothetical protein [Acerihabitans arboris]
MISSAIFPGAAAADGIGDANFKPFAKDGKYASIGDGQLMLSDRGEDDIEDVQCHIAIQLPNAHANAQHQSFVAEFSRLTEEKRWTLGWLLEYDQFLAHKVKYLFDHMLYLDKKRESLDTILLKKYCEKIIASCLAVPPSQLVPNNTLHANNDGRIFLKDFFTDIDNDFRHAFKEIDFRVLRQSIALKNGMSFSEAKEHLNKIFKTETKDHEKKHKKNILLIWG